MGQPASKLGLLSACQQNVIRMAFQWRADNGPIVHAYWVSISFESYMYLFLDPGYVLFRCSVCFSERLIRREIPWLCCMSTTKALISLRIRTV